MKFFVEVVVKVIKGYCFWSIENKNLYVLGESGSEKFNLSKNIS